MALGRAGVMGSLAVALFVSLAACSLSGRSQRKAEQQTSNNAEAAAMRRELEKVAGMVSVQVNYSNYITNPGSAHVSLIVGKGADLERMADLAVERVWRSRLDPLDFIRVTVGSNTEDGNPGTERNYLILDNHEDPRDKTAELEAKYGPRSVKPR